MNSLDGRHTLLDATTFSVVRSRVNSIVEEMTYTLERSAFGSTLRHSPCSTVDRSQTTGTERKSPA